MAALLSWVVSNLAISGLLAAVAFFASRALRNPHVAHGLWLLVLIKLITPPIYVLETSWLQDSNRLPEETTPTAPMVSALAPEPFLEPLDMEGPESLTASAESIPEVISPDPIVPVSNVPSQIEPIPHAASPAWGLWEVLLLVWGLGALISCGRVVRRCWRFRALLKLATPAGGDIDAEASSLSKQLGLGRVPSVLSIEAQIPPLVWGVFQRPRILLPRKLFAQLTLSQRQAVLAHELAHIRRQDHIFRWIEVAAHVLYWWYPISWWAIRELRRAEEECCDALVIWLLPETRQSYGQALFKTVEFLAGTPLSVPAIAGGAMSVPPLKRRIESIMNRNLKHRMSWQGWFAMLLIAAATLPVVAQTTALKKPKEASQGAAETPASDPPSKPAASAQETPSPRQAATTKPVPDESAAPQEKMRQFLAQLKAATDVRISTLHAGIVSEVLVAEGDNVKSGQVLVKIRNTEMEIRLEEAEGELRVQIEKNKASDVAIHLAKSGLTTADIEYKNAKRLFDQKVVSSEEFELKTAALDRAQLILQKAELDRKTSAVELSILEKRMESAQRLVEELSIKAPVSGVVLDLGAKAGELIQANAPVCRVFDMGTLIAEARVSDPRGLSGKLVFVCPHGASGIKLPAKVTFVSPFADPVTGLFRIRCEFKNVGEDEKPLAYPGQPANMLIPTSRSED